MGNQLAAPQKFEQDHLADVPSLVFKEHLGGSRLLKTVLCCHDKGGQVVVKVYHKRGDVDLDKYEKQLRHIRSRLSGLPGSHVWPFQHYFVTDKAAYLLRQHIFANLYHRLSTRPFVASIEKQWIAFQLLHAVAQSHDQGICHGDIKTENVLVTSWNWIFLADFASYKPAFLPADNPADFSFFFDTGGRRRCYLAPERFYSVDSVNMDNVTNAPLKPSMDIFSLGCVLAELFLDGQRLFDLSDLLSYKIGKFDPSTALQKVEEPFRGLILHMVSLEPAKRHSASTYLLEWGAQLFPAYFDALLHPFFASMIPLDTDARIRVIEREFPSLVDNLLGNGVEKVGPARQPVGRKYSMSAGTSESAALETSSPEKRQLGGKDALRKLCSGTVLMSENLQRRASRDTQVILEDTPTDIIRPDPSDARAVILEETYEFQCREKGKGFKYPKSTAHLEAFKEWTPSQQRVKEKIVLPDGWQWTDDWHIDKETATDTEGWAYRVRSQAGGAEWAPKCLIDCHWRKRKWTRQRRKTGNLDQIATQVKQMKARHSGNSQAFLIIATLLCSTIRGAIYQENKSKVIRLLGLAAKYCDDDFRLQRIIPYLMEGMSIPLCQVRWTALQGLVHVLGLVQHLPVSDAKLFTEYVLPSLSMLPNDREEWMLVAYALAIGPLAASSQACLANMHRAQLTQESQIKYEQELAETREKVERVVHEMMVGTKSSNHVKQALLATVDLLATFLGSKESNDFLMPLLLASLNAQDWRLKSCFLRAAFSLARHAGPTGVDSYLVPCLPQALNGKDDTVVAEAVAFLSEVTKAGLLPRRPLLRILQDTKDLKVLPGLLAHDSAAVRQSAISFLAATTQALSSTDSYVYIRPRVFSAFEQQPADFGDPAGIVQCLPHRKISPALSRAQTPSTSRGQGKSKERTEVRDKTLMVKSSAHVYSVMVDKSKVMPNESFLTAALRQHARRGSEGGKPDGPQTRVLMRKARRMARASPDMSSLTGGLVPALQLSSDEALSFQADSWRGSPAGSTISSAIGAAMNTSLPTQPQRSALDTSPWRPQGVLVMHMAEHRAAVNSLAVSATASYFASASSDGTVKIWDSKRLEHDAIFRSKLTYNSQGGKILGCSACEEDDSMASSSSDGSIHLWKVEYAAASRTAQDRYTSVTGQEVANPGEGAILTLDRWNKTLVYTTERGIIHGMDLRTRSDVWTLHAPASGGLWKSMILDNKANNWLAVGSTRGSVALWDMRFQVCVKDWSLKDRSSICKMSLCLAGHRRLGIASEEATAGPLVYVSSQAGNVGLWELATGRCHQILQPASFPSNNPGANQHPVPNPSSKTTTRFATEDLQSHTLAPTNAVQAMLPMAGGSLLTASTDGCIRLWDASPPEQSYMVCGPPFDVDSKNRTVARTGVKYATRVQRGQKLIVEQLSTSELDTSASGTASLKAMHRRAALSHADSVTALSQLSVLGERMLLSASADGCVKVWK